MSKTVEPKPECCEDCKYWEQCWGFCVYDVESWV